MPNLGDEIPNFAANSTAGPLRFHDWIGDSWAILFSHPNDFTPVCTTELAKVASIHEDFKKRGVKVIALSCNSIESHQDWIKDIVCYGKLDNFPYPIIADPDRSIAVSLGMLDPVEKDSAGAPLTCRGVFVIDSAKKIRLVILYPATTGRNFCEILRAIDSLQLTDKNHVATPADWQHGQHCMILPSIPAEEIPKLFPNGHETVELPSKKKYLRTTPQPN